MAFTTKTLTVVAALGGCQPALAQSGGAAPPSATATFSSECSVPTSAIAAAAPLPNMTRKIAQKAPITVLAMGSSSTWGPGPASSSLEELQEILKRLLRNVSVDVVSRGVSGEPATTAADRLRMEASILKPDLVLWQLGTNDAFQRASVDEFTRVVSQTILGLKRRNIDVVLVGLQYTPRHARDDHYVAMRDALRKIATEHNVMYVRRYSAMEYIQNATALLSDTRHGGIDFNDVGSKCLAEHIAQAMTASIFAREQNAK